MATYEVIASHNPEISNVLSSKLFDATNAVVSHGGDLMLVEYNQKSMVPEYFNVIGFASGTWKKFVRID